MTFDFVRLVINQSAMYKFKLSRYRLKIRLFEYVS